MKQNPFSGQLQQHNINVELGMACKFNDNMLFKKTIFGEDREKCLDWRNVPMEEGIDIDTKPKNWAFLTDREKQFFLAELGTPSRMGFPVPKYHLMVSFQYYYKSVCCHSAKLKNIITNIISIPEKHSRPV